MTAGRYAVGAMGVRVVTEVSGDRAAEVLDRLPSLWEYCPADDLPEDAPTVTVEVVHVSDEATGRAADAAGQVSRRHADDLLQVLTQRITVAAIDALAGRVHLLHAAALADPGTGIAHAFVAPGGTGKTTLVRTLGPGFAYVTDETVAVADDLTVSPYPKPLSIRRTPGSLLKDETPPRALGLTPSAGPVRLGAVWLLDRREDHDGPPAVRLLDPLDAVVALTQQVSHLAVMDRPLQRLAAVVDAVGGLRRVTYRDATDLRHLLGEDAAS